MKIPFKVSSRTARLIGRENVATAKGAIIELVKNGYDADSRYSIVYIDNELSFFKDKLSVEEYDKLCTKGIDNNLLQSIYHLMDDEYILNDGVDSSLIQTLSDQLKQFASLYVIDCGEGMTHEIIKNYWMIIGTDNKSTNFYTKKGRIKAGAKGIGRFAMDKLGANCEMTTIYDKDVHHDYDEDGKESPFCGYQWIVAWDDFEGTNKTLDSVNADLEGLKDVSFIDCVRRMNLPESINVVLREDTFEHGTILKITNLRDVWDDESVKLLFEDLGVLVPPSENKDYSIILRSSSLPAEYGEVESSVCDDFDFKIEAHADSKQTVHIKIIRKENLVEALPPSFFARPNQQKANYTKADFERGYWETTRTFAQLLPGFNVTDYAQVFSRIGSFDFVFYFMKRSATKKGEVRFFYRPCAYNLRADWLQKFGGIKLFRDGFRVRPYGERNDSAFDWLGLGARKQKSPAGIAKPEGGYRVEVENVAGSICISRLTNVEFEDKSSREGLQENSAFQVFKRLIQGIIAIFEEDRALIARELTADDEYRNGEARDMRQAEELAKKILAKQRERQENNQKEPGRQEKGERYSMELLAALNEKKTLEIEQLREEQKVLRALASSGLMLASFSHDLSKIHDSLNDRYDKIQQNLLPFASEEMYVDREDRKNPYRLMDKARSTDQKMQNWLRFSTGIIKKDKRRQKLVDIKAYTESLLQTWAGIFEQRAITVEYEIASKLKMRAFEIDFDSIFYNLFSNSIEAFNMMRVNRPRKIEILWTSTDKEIICEYKDNGTGLSSDIVTPEDIFKPLFTTKRNNTTGEEIGTGLGMWIVKLIAEDNDARINLLNLNYGFGIRFVYPQKYVQSVNELTNE